MNNITIDLENMFDKLFARRKVSMNYKYHSGMFLIELEGKELDEHLEDLIIIYNYMKIHNLVDRFISYETMIKYMDDESLYSEIFRKLD